MRFLVLMVMFTGVAFSQALLSEDSAGGPGGKEPVPEGSYAPVNSVNLAPAVPPVPSGKTTVIGGAIRTVDHLQDRLTLKIYGGRDMKIFFDGRTQVYRDGQPTTISDLRPGERISVETLLDGEAVFARSIHALTQSLDGETHGQVLSFDRASGTLLVRDGLDPRPIKIEVPASAAIVGQGQQAASPTALGPGALVAVIFKPDGNGRAVAQQISILATPGSSFIFSGNVSYLDLHSGILVVIDPRDQKRYEISFDPKLPIRQSLREGIGVTVTAGFDGSRYSAQNITLSQPSPQQ